jgi:hypothetical protein
MALRLKAELGGDGAGFDAMMRRANMSVGKLGGVFGGLKSIIAGAFTVGAISNFTRKTIDLAKGLRDVSDALAVDVEWFQKMANGAKLAGASQEDLVKFMQKLNESREAAFQRPDGDLAQRFGRLGMSGEDISGLNTREFFEKLTKKFSEGITTQTAVDVAKVGGESARKLMAAFRNGFESDLPTMPAHLVDELAEIGDGFHAVSLSLRTGMAPAIIAVAEAIGFLMNKSDELVNFLGGYLEGQRQERRWSDGYNQAGPTERFIREWSGFEYIASLIRGHETGMVLGGQTALDTVEGQAVLAAAIKEAVAARQAAREAAAAAPPNFEPRDPPTLDRPAPGRSPRLVTDSLVGVGNFFGRNPALVNTIANQQLQVARDHVRISQATFQLLRDRLNDRPALAETATFPPT